MYMYVTRIGLDLTTLSSTEQVANRHKTRSSEGTGLPDKSYIHVHYLSFQQQQAVLQMNWYT